MQKHMVITATGQDKVGLVDRITEVLLEYNANVEESRMARLGGEFAMIILVSLPDQKLNDLIKGMEKLTNIGLTTTCKPTESIDSKKYEGYVPFELILTGADQEGIVHRVAHYLKENGINIETLDTTITNAPITGTPLFTMHGIIQVPRNIGLQVLRNNLNKIGDEIGTDIEVKMAVR